MHKALKIIGIVVGVLLLLAIVGIVSLITFVSPNRLKPVLTDQVMKYTGRTLIIDGDMSWTFFPYLGVKVGHSSLGNPAGFGEKTFAEMSSITVGVKLMPLFDRKIESSGIVLDGMKLHLIKNRDGKVNWNFQLPASTPEKNSPEKKSSGDDKDMMMGLAVSGISVNNAMIDYTDSVTKKNYDIKNFELNAKNINLRQSFPVTTSFDFKATNPAMSGHAALKGNIALDLLAQKYTISDIDFSANLVQDNKNIKMNVSGNVIADMKQQTLQWTGFKAKIANIDMTGKLEVTHLATSPVTTAHVVLAPFDLKQTLQEIGQPVANLQTAKSVQGDVDVAINSDGAKMQGDLTIDTLQAAKITLTHVALKAHFQKGVLDLAPMTANLYQGTLNGQALVNLNGTVPQMTLHAKLSNVQAQPLMDDLGGSNQKVKIAGAGNFEMQVTTAGVESKAILQNLNGVSQFSFVNGTMIGVDLGYLVDSAYALLKHQPMNAKNAGETHFGTLTGTAVIRSGVISNSDLTGDTPRFSIHGAGTIDLVNQKLDYSLQTSVKQRADQKDNAMNLYGITIPVLITGPLDNPAIRLDSATLAKAVAEQQIKKITNQTKDQLKDQIKKQLPGKAGDLLNGKAGDVLNNLLGS